MADQYEISYAGIFLSSAFAACFAELCTIPLDIAKVRLQLQKRAASGGEDGVSSAKYKGLFSTVVTIAKEEGLGALWTGIVPGLHRQCVYGGLRIGLYGPVKAFLGGGNVVGRDVSLFVKILAALVTGAIAIVVANPTDLVKVRLQAEGKIPTGTPRRYAGALDAYYTIAKEEGLAALWTGVWPNIARNSIINAAELASYDHVKEAIMKFPGFSDSVLTHLLAGMGAGFFAVCIGSPVDVAAIILCNIPLKHVILRHKCESDVKVLSEIKSRMMGDSIYKSTLDCFFKTLRHEGPFAFYKGFLPNFGRLGLWNAIMFLTLEQVKILFI